MKNRTLPFKILSILAFIHSGLLIVGSILFFLYYGLSAYDNENYRFSLVTLLSVFSSFLFFIGVFQMWKLRIKGYYLFLIGGGLSVTCQFLLQNLLNTEFTFSVKMLIPLLFVILYSFNRKYLID